MTERKTGNKSETELRGGGEGVRCGIEDKRRRTYAEETDIRTALRVDGA